MRKIYRLLAACALQLLSACAVVQIGNVSATPKPIKDTVSFETLSDGYDLPAKHWEKTEIERQISGKTFLRNYPGKINEVLYFSPDNIVYQWVSGSSSVGSATWVVDAISSHMGQSAKLFICTTLKKYVNIRPDVNVTRRCIDPALLFIPASDHVNGDVFSIAGKTSAPGVFSLERTNIELLKKQLKIN